MRILIIPSWYPSPESPVNGVFIHEQAKAIARRLDVAVLTPRFPSFADQVRLRWGPALIRENDHGIDTWKVRRLKLPTLRRWVPFCRFPDQELVYCRKFASAVRKGFAWYVRECGLPDLIHAHVVLPAGWIAAELAKEHGIPIVLTEHSGPFAMHLTTPRQRTLVGDILRQMDGISAVSPTLRTTMQAFCPDLRIDVIGNVIDTDFFVPADSPLRVGQSYQPDRQARKPDLRKTRASRPFRFLFVGMLREAKGVQHLFNAVHRLLTAGLTDFEVYVGGDGPHRPALERMASALKIDQHCRFLGLLNREQVRVQMQDCDVFVLPSLGETFGVVLGEAMACGKPVLSTRCGGPEDVVTPETGILVPPADPAALAEAMKRFLTGAHSFDARLVRESVVQRFGAEAFLDQTQRFYENTLRRYAQPARRKAG